MNRNYVQITKKGLAEYRAIRQQAKEITDALNPTESLRETVIDVIEAVIIAGYLIIPPAELPAVNPAINPVETD